MKKELKPGKDFIGIGGGVLIFNKKITKKNCSKHKRINK